MGKVRGQAGFAARQAPALPRGHLLRARQGGGRAAARQEPRGASRRPRVFRVVEKKVPVTRQSLSKRVTQVAHIAPKKAKPAQRSSSESQKREKSSKELAKVYSRSARELGVCRLALTLRRGECRRRAGKCFGGVDRRARARVARAHAQSRLHRAPLGDQGIFFEIDECLGDIGVCVC